MAVQLYCKAVTDPDPQIRGGGGGGGGHPDPEISVGGLGAVSKKLFFSPMGLSLV